MIKTTFLLLALFYSMSLIASPKRPYGLLTPSYGVVTEDDLAYDSFFRKIGPYDPKKSLGELYWQCLPVENVNAGFKAWVGKGGMGPQHALYTMCTLEIGVHVDNDTQTFADRRAHQIEFCLDFIKEWKRLTENQKIVCLNGEGGAYDDGDKNIGRQKLWTWNKFKTKKGCYSFFAGSCSTTGCSQNKGSCKKIR